MTDRFDDMMKNRLNGLESEVPRGMFDNLRNRLNAEDQSFDGEIHSQLSDYTAPVPSNMFAGVQDRLDAIDQSFDNHIAASLDKHAAAVPADMWERIRNEKDRRSPIAWWWAAAAILLLGAGIWIYTDHKPAIGTPDAQDDKQASNTVVAAERPGTSPAESPGNTKSGVSSTDNASPNKTAASTGTSNGTDETQPAREDGAVAPALNASAKNGTGNGNGVLGNKNPTIYRSGKNKFTQSVDLTRGEKGKTTNGRFVPAVANSNAGDKDSEEELVNAAFTPAANAGLNEFERQLALRQQIRSSFKLNKLQPEQLINAASKNPVLPCPPGENEPRNDWYVEAYASPMVIFKTLSGNGIGKNTINSMDSTLHRQVSFNAGINLVKNIGEQFLIKAGVQYGQVNEVFRNTRINEIKLITTVTIRTVILSPGDTLYIRDTSVIRQVGTVTKQTQNHYRSWDVPVIIGYEFGGKDLRLNANLGLIANINNSYMGEMLDTLQQTINIANHRSTGVYKTNIGLGVYAGLGILKSIGKRTDLLIEPHARFNLGNMTNDPLWFRQKNINAGLSLGIRYKFNGYRQR